MSGFEIFDPKLALDPTAFTGQAGASRLLDAASHFPGGPTVLVFALFWAPVGPGIPAGVLLARHVPLGFLSTFGLYTLSDVLAAFVFGPVFAVLRRHGRHVPKIRALGRRLLSFAMIGTGVKSFAEPATTAAPALFRIATVGFGVDVYTAGALATALPVPRVPGWLSAIAGDLVWFALLLTTSVAAGWLVDDDRVVGLAVIAAMILIPRVAQRWFPSLRPG